MFRSRRSIRARRRHAPLRLGGAGAAFVNRGALAALLMLRSLPAASAQADEASLANSELGASHSMFPAASPSDPFATSPDPDLLPREAPQMTRLESERATPPPGAAPADQTSTSGEATWAGIRITAVLSAISLFAGISFFEIVRRTKSFGDIFDRKRETKPGRTPPKLLPRLFEFVFSDGYVDAGYAEYARKLGQLERVRVQELGEVQASARENDEAKLHDYDPSSPPVGPSIVQEEKDDVRDISSPPAGKSIVQEEKDDVRDISSPPVGKSIVQEEKDDLRDNSVVVHVGRSTVVVDVGGDYPRSAVEESTECCERDICPLDSKEEEEEITSAMDESDVIGKKQVSFEELDRSVLSLSSTDRAARDDDDSTDSDPEAFARLEKSASEKKLVPALPDSDDDDWADNYAEAFAQLEKSATEKKFLPDSSRSGDNWTDNDAEALAQPEKNDRANGDAGNRPAPSRLRFVWVSPGAKLRFRWGDMAWIYSPPFVKQRPSPRLSDGGNHNYDEPGDEKYRKDKKPCLGWCLGCLRRIPSIPSILEPLPLTESDRELLRCTGLDTFTLLRFLRLGFECTFYPFLVACVTLIPLYFTHGSSTNGYFSITIGHLSKKSPKLWVTWCFALGYYFFLLRRIWVEWVVFVGLRRDFLVDGDCIHDPDTWKEDHRETLKQYRNSCFVQRVPPTHRSDKDLFEFFNALFPGMIVRAEMVLHSEKLSDLIRERQQIIESYERVHARYSYQEKTFHRKMRDESKSVIGWRRTPSPPQKPMARIGGTCSFGGELVDAMPYYMSEIDRLNWLVDEEFSALVRRKKASEECTSVGEVDANCGNAFVEFTSRATKQFAMRCNLTNKGEWNSFRMLMAPDPGDIVWDNAVIESSITKSVLFFVELLLVAGILFWSALGSFISNIGTAIMGNDSQSSDLILNLVSSYLPVLGLTLIMMALPGAFQVIGCKIIRFKTRSETDRFVLKWNLCYRIANFLVVLISGTIYSALVELRSNPGEVVEKLANGILKESQFFLNLVLISTGMSTMYELSCVRHVAKYLLLRCIYKFDALSEREKERMKTPDQLFYGKYIPEFIYVFLIAVVYSTIVPLILGVCSVYFFVASKVYSHNALFVYVQHYDGGGKFMYSINRIFFILLYVSIILFGTVLYLNGNLGASISFLAILIFVTYRVDMQIRRRFIKTSYSPSLESARIMDKEYESRDFFGKYSIKGKKDKYPNGAERVSFRLSSNSPPKERQEQGRRARPALRRAGLSVGTDIANENRWPEDIFRLGQPHILNGGDLGYYLYRQPDLNKAKWETKPRPY